MKMALLSAPGPKYVLIVDWSQHVYPSYVFTVNGFTHLVAETVYSFLKINNVPLELTEIIGKSCGAAPDDFIADDGFFRLLHQCPCGWNGGGAGNS